MVPQGYVSVSERANISFCVVEIYSSRSIPLAVPTVLSWEPNRSCLAQVFQSTGTWKWTRLSTFSKVVEFLF